MNISTSCAILVTFCPETSEFTMLTIEPVVAIRQKLAYHAKYHEECSGPTLTYFTDLVGLLVGMIFQIFVWQLANGRCYGMQTSYGTNLVFASAFDKGLADHESAFKRFNGNNQATSCPNLVNFHPVISEFTRVHRVLKKRQ